MFGGIKTVRFLTWWRIPAVVHHALVATILVVPVGAVYRRLVAAVTPTHAVVAHAVWTHLRRGRRNNKGEDRRGGWGEDKGGRKRRGKK